MSKKKDAPKPEPPKTDPKLWLDVTPGDEDHEALSIGELGALRDCRAGQGMSAEAARAEKWRNVKVYEAQSATWRVELAEGGAS